MPCQEKYIFGQAAKKIIDEYSASLKLLAIANDEAISIEGDTVRIEGGTRM